MRCACLNAMLCYVIACECIMLCGNPAPLGTKDLQASPASAKLDLIATSAPHSNSRGQCLQAFA